MSKRDVTLEPHNQCLPMGVPRTTPFPFRFRAELHRQAAVTPLHPGRGEHPHLPSDLHGRPEASAGRRARFDVARTFDRLVGRRYARHRHASASTTSSGSDRRGHPHTEQLHIIERWTRKDMGHMENVVTIDDPAPTTKPFTMRFMATWTPGDELLEYICQENNQHGVETLPATAAGDTSNSAGGSGRCPATREPG